MPRTTWDTSGFTEPNGRFVSTQAGIKAFVPSPLPVKWTAHGQLLNMYVRAEKAMSSLNTVANMIGVSDLLTALYIRNEAVQSSIIEGTLASLDDLLQYEAAKHIDAEEADRLSMAEVSNCVKAMEESMEEVTKTGEIDIDLVKTAHRTLWLRVRGQEMNIGTLRKGQNAIKNGRGDIVFVPPPPDHAESLMEGLISFMSVKQPEIPTLIQCAMAHYQFEAIHPFGDGNGRVGRMLIPLILAKNGELGKPLLQLGEYLAANRSEYYMRLEMVSQKSDWDGWCMLFMRAFAEQAEATTRSIMAMAEIQDRYAKMVSGTGRSIAARILELLFSNPYITTRRVQGDLRVSHTGAARGIARLEKMGILTKISGTRRRRVWVATEIINTMRSAVPTGTTRV